MAIGAILSGVGALGNILGSGQSQRQSQSSTEEGTQTSRRGSVGVDNVLNEMLRSPALRRSTADTQSVSLQRAEQDVSGVVDSIFSDYRSEFLPEVFTASEGAGVYGSSSTQEMADRGYADATSRAAELTLGTANTYATQLQQEQQMMQQFITQLFGLDLEESGEVETSAETTGNTRGSGRGPMDFTGLTQIAANALAPNPTRE